MKFFEFVSNYAKDKRNCGKDFPWKKDPFGWYDIVINQIERLRGRELGNDLMTMHAERELYATGQPYFKVYPGMADMMAEIDLQIPCEHINFPYTSFTILLADDEKNHIRDIDGCPVSSILVSKRCVRASAGHKFKVVPEHLADNVIIHVSYRIHNGDKDEMWCSLPLGRIDNPSSHKMLSDVIDDMATNFRNPSMTDSEVELSWTVLKVAIATCFFGIDQHEYVLPDWPRKKIERRARQFNGDAIAALKSESTDLVSTKNWSIGKEIELPRPIVTKSKEEEHHTGSRKHAYARRGHMRWQAHGKGKKARKLIFIHPHICRPDLPIKQHGYTIPDLEKN